MFSYLSTCQLGTDNFHRSLLGEPAHGRCLGGPGHGRRDHVAGGDAALSRSGGGDPDPRVGAAHVELQSNGDPRAFCPKRSARPLRPSITSRRGTDASARSIRASRCPSPGDRGIRSRRDLAKELVVAGRRPLADSGAPSFRVSRRRRGGDRATRRRDRPPSSRPSFSISDLPVSS